MLDVQRLPVALQRNVGRELASLLKAHKYTAGVTAKAKAVIAAADALAPAEGPPMALVDTTTDSVLTAVRRVLRAWAATGPADVVDVTPALKQKVDAAQSLNKALFPDGIGFIRSTWSLERDELARIAAALAQPAVKKAIAALSLEAVVGHLEAHIALYANTLGVHLGSASAPGQNGEAFHQSFVLFAAQVAVDYAEDPEIKSALLAPYQNELATYRKQLRAERKKHKKRASTPTAPTAPTGVGSGSAPGAPTAGSTG